MLYRGLLTDVIDSLLKCCVFNVLQAIGVDMSTTRALEMCTKYVLNPFHIFLKVVSQLKVCKSENVSLDGLIVTTSLLSRTDREYL